MPQCPTRGDVTAEESKKLACGGKCEAALCSAGPCLAELVVSVAERPFVLAADEEHVYWATEAGGAISRWSVAGMVDELVDAGGSVGGLARHADRLYWTAQQGQSPVRGSLGSMVLPAGSVVTSEVEGTLRSVAVSDARVYFADFERGLMSAAIGDGKVRSSPLLVAGWTNASGVAVLGGLVVWSQLNLDGSIRFFSDDEPERTTLVACHQQWPSAVTVDDQRIYWINKYIYEAEGRLMAQGFADTAPRVLLDDRPRIQPRSIAGSANYLYWVENEVDLMRLRK